MKHTVRAWIHQHDQLFSAGLFLLFYTPTWAPPGRFLRFSLQTKGDKFAADSSTLVSSRLLWELLDFCLFVSRKLLVIWPDRCLQNETKSTTCGCCIIEIFLRFDVKRLKALHRSEVWRWHASRTRSYVTRRGRLWVCFVHSRETSSILHKMGGAMSRKQDFSTIYVKTSLTLWNFKLSQSGFLLKEQFCTIIEHVVHFFHWCFDAWKQPLNPQMKSRLLRG